LGAAYLAGLATGFWSSRGEIDEKWRLARRYEPRMSEDERDRLYAKWTDAVARSSGWARP
jgi:glycerol kinase